MTKPLSAALGPSGPGALVWTAEELVGAMPDLAPELHDTNIDPEAFASWLREPLERYRAHAKAREQMAQKAAVLKWLVQAASEIDAALDDGRLERLPAWFADPAVNHAALKLGLNWAALIRGKQRDLVAQCLRDACASLERQRARRGRPAERVRDALLHAVVEYLKAAGITPARAQDLAESILVLCRVPTPEASVARAARRGRGSISV